ncbi:MAG TPA: tetratricopeptide repeat protein [Pirellulales bacterium]|nr:tetratricopeptide repeat protein [Pirellulales bacterium]
MPRDKSIARRGPPWPDWAVAGFLITVIAIIFGQTLWFDFLTYDDAWLVSGNRLVNRGLTVDGISAAFVSGPAGEWYPLSMISHMLDCQIFGLSAWGHHLTNLVLHAATTIGLFLVLRNMTGELWPSALVATLLAIHPQHVESVAWIAERRDVLSGLFFVLTLAAWLGYVRHGCRLDRYLLVALVFTLGLMSKATLVTLPPLLMLLDYWPLGRFGQAAETTGGAERKSLGWLAVEKLPLLALAVGDCVLTVVTHIGDTTGGRSFTERLAGAVVALVEYLRQAFYPAGLSAFYPTPAGGYPAWKIAGSVALLAAITIAALAWRRGCPYLFVGWFWFVGTLVPVLGFLTISAHAMSDRYMYLPQIGLSIAVVWGATRLVAGSVQRRYALGGCTVLVIVALVACAAVQTTYWHDDLRLWTHSLAVTGSNGIGERALADALNRAGRRQEAIEHYRRAIEWGFDPQAMNNMGLALAGEKRFLEATDQFRALLQFDPNSLSAHTNLGLVLAEQGKDDEAAEHYRQAITLNRHLVKPHYGLARLLAKQGRSEEAIAEFEQVIALAPHIAGPHADLAAELVRLGRTDEAIARYRQALQFAPHDAALQNALDRLLKTKTLKQ